MEHVVSKPFNTITQRFKVGASVTEADVTPLDWEHLKARGFVSEPSASVAPAPFTYSSKPKSED